jgi:hypothetical protein
VSTLSLMVNAGRAAEANELVGPANRVFLAGLGHRRIQLARWGLLLMYVGPIDRMRGLL